MFLSRMSIGWTSYVDIILFPCSCRLCLDLFQSHFDKHTMCFFFFFCTMDDYRGCLLLTSRDLPSTSQSIWVEGTVIEVWKTPSFRNHWFSGTPIVPFDVAPECSGLCLLVKGMKRPVRFSSHAFENAYPIWNICSQTVTMLIPPN